TLTAAAEIPIGVDQAGATAAGTTQATWSGPDGSAHAGPIPVPAPQPAGSTVPIWVDRQGAPAPPPVDRTQAAVTAVVGGVLVLLAGGLALFGVRALVRARCAAANHRAWSREWAFYEPLWSNRA
ncbi:Rv1733c family protein, partial [Pseudonocardia pini]|uniref:Rv1733c family protein n=1 Tax=Pseudonocardia pini TaxID=2758030 RepID=UPI00406BA412